MVKTFIYNNRITNSMARERTRRMISESVKSTLAQESDADKEERAARISRGRIAHLESVPKYLRESFWDATDKLARGTNPSQVYENLLMEHSESDARYIMNKAINRAIQELKKTS